MKTLTDLAVQALEVQNASNPLGLAHGFHEAMTYLRDHPSVLSTDNLLSHPIYRLWVMKLADLGGITVEPEQFADAFDQTSAIAFGIRADVPGISDERAELLATDSWLAAQLSGDDPDDETDLEDDAEGEHDYREDADAFLYGLESEQSEPVVGRCWPQ